MFSVNKHSFINRSGPLDLFVLSCFIDFIISSYEKSTFNSLNIIPNSSFIYLSLKFITSSSSV